MPAPDRKLHITNSQGRNATVVFGTVKAPSRPKSALPGKDIRFIRFLAATPTTTHDELAKAHGEDYADALIAGDPEVDIERVGRVLGDTTTVWLSSTGDVMHAAPQLVEVVLAPDGEERERREWTDRPSNVNDETPVRWTGRKLPRAEVVRTVIMRRTISLVHVDGLTYDFLYGMAKDLHESKSVVLMAGGQSGKDPLVFQSNGLPFRAFLEGRVDGDRYQLLLHLSNMEMKVPAQLKPMETT